MASADQRHSASFGRSVLQILDREAGAVAELDLTYAIRNVIWRQFLSFDHEQGDGSHEDYDDPDGNGTRRIL
jgi:hypothetical protein